MKPEARLRSRCRMYLDDALPKPGDYSAVETSRWTPGMTQMQFVREAQRAKAQGIKNGVADIYIVHDGMTLWVELKCGRNKQSPEQIAFQASMRANKVHCEVVRSVCELDRLLRSLGVPVPLTMWQAAIEHDAALAVEKVKKPITYRPRGARTAKPTLAQIAKFESIRK